MRAGSPAARGGGSRACAWCGAECNPGGLITDSAGRNYPLFRSAHAAASGALRRSAGRLMASALPSSSVSAASTSLYGGSMSHLVLASSDHNPVPAGASGDEPVVLRVRLEPDVQLRSVAQLRHDGFLRIGGRALSAGQRVHATFVLSRDPTLTVSAVAGEGHRVERGRRRTGILVRAGAARGRLDVLVSTTMHGDVVH